MSQPHKRHHFIPQCYLKKFSSNNKSLWTYDKISSKEFSQAIDRICCIEDFYKLPSPEDPLFLECEFFSKNVEAPFNNILNKIIDKKNQWLANPSLTPILTAEEKLEFASYIAIQWLRTPEIRKQNHQFNKDFLSDTISLFKEGLAIEKGNPEIAKLDITYDINHVIEHAHLFTNNIVDPYATALVTNYWEFYVSNEDNVYTSDFPIIQQHHQKNVPLICDGLASEGCELSFPLSKNIILVMWDHQFFAEKKNKDNTFSYISEKNMHYYNYIRYCYSKRQIYASNQYFELIRILYNNTNKHEFNNPYSK